MLDERRTRRMIRRFTTLLLLCLWVPSGKVTSGFLSQLPGTLFAQTLDRIRQDNGANATLSA
jgi:hypothetical protein